MTLFEKITIGITATYVVVAFFQWLGIKEQAKIARDNVARLERPWILVSMETFPYKTGVYHSGGRWYFPDGNPIDMMDVFTSKATVHVRYTTRNHGKSPGWITSSWANATRVDSEGALPIPPNYFSKTEGISAKSERLVAPQGRFGTTFHIPVHHMRALNDKVMFLYVYGIINYRDVWGKAHVTRFGFFYHVPDESDINERGFYRNLPTTTNKLESKHMPVSARITGRNLCVKYILALAREG